MRIVIDAGHGPNTPGKRSPDGTLREYQFNSVAARYVAETLKQYDNIEIMLTHDDSRDVPLKERTDRANAWKADLFVSIHANAFGSGGWNDARGIETFRYTYASEAAKKAAASIHKHLLMQTGLMDRGVKVANFHVLRETKMPAVLVECGFMTNREEAEFLKSDAYRRKCAAAIVSGIAEAFCLKRKGENEPMTKEERAAFDALREDVAALYKLYEASERMRSMPCPDWARPAIEAAQRTIGPDGNPIVIEADGGSYDFYRLISVMHRAGLIK